jgi:Xanthomonas phage major coat protein
MDFSSILEGLSVTSGTTALIAAGALIALMGFTGWASRKVAGFFGK